VVKYVCSRRRLARRPISSPELRTDIGGKSNVFPYNLNVKLEETRLKEFSWRCKDTVPQAVLAFLESNDYVDCIKNSILIGGDTDSIAAMSGGIAEAYYKVIPPELIEFANSKLPDEIKEVVKDFEKYKKLKS
jgi:ADP-ribosylglycohydrolase